MITLHDSPDSAERYVPSAARREWPQSQSGQEQPLLQKTQGMIESAIGNYPVVALGAALFAGIALGWWIKRR